MQVLSMVHLERHLTPIPGSETRKRMYHLEIELTILYQYYITDSWFVHKYGLAEQKLSDEPS